MTIAYVNSVHKRLTGYGTTIVAPAANHIQGNFLAVLLSHSTPPGDIVTWLSVEDKLVTETGSFNSTATSQASEEYEAIHATFKAASQISWVNTIAAYNDGGSGFSSIGVTGNHTSGNLLIVFVAGHGTQNNHVTGISDTAGNSYTQIDRVQRQHSGGWYYWIECWYAKNITGNSSNIVTASLTNTGYNFSVTLCVLQYLGCDQSAPYDVHGVNNGQEASQSTPAVQTNYANEIIVAGYHEGGTVGWRPGSGFTKEYLTVRVSSVTDTAGNTYYFGGLSQYQNQSGSWSTDYRMECWYAPNIIGNANNVVTVNLNGSGDDRLLTVLQYSGVLTTTPFDVYGTGGGYSSGAGWVSTTSKVISNAYELIIAAYEHEALAEGSVSAGPGFTKRVPSDETYLTTEDRIVSRIDSYNSSVYFGLTGQDWIAIHAAFSGGRIPSSSFIF